MVIPKAALFLLYKPQRGMFTQETDQRMSSQSMPDQSVDTTTPEASGHALASRRRRILVVDDEAAARVLAFRVFSEAGFDVTTAKSGFECLEHFRKRPSWFDLIVL